jgi:hypothetical protein
LIGKNRRPTALIPNGLLFMKEMKKSRLLCRCLLPLLHDLPLVPLLSFFGASPRDFRKRGAVPAFLIQYFLL